MTMRKLVILLFIPIVGLLFYMLIGDNDVENTKIPNPTTASATEDSDCEFFDFSLLDKGYWSWYKSKKVTPIDTSVKVELLNTFEEFEQWKDYQTLYYLCYVNSLLGFSGKIIVQRIHNDSESNMFFLYKDGNNRLSIFLVASISKSPEDFLNLRSKIEDENTINTFKVFISDDGVSAFKDSIITTYLIRDMSFVRVKTDSIRVIM